MSSTALLNNAGIPIALSSFLFLVWQMLLISSGLFVGIIGMWVYDLFGLSYEIKVLSSFFFISTIIFLSAKRPFPRSIARSLRIFLKSEFPAYEIPFLSDVFILLIINWMLMGAAFVLFFHSLSINTGLSPVFFQPLANNIGVIAFFAPAGVGVREGLMVAYLSFAGIAMTKTALAVIMARFWFTIVEVFLFIVGIFVGKLSDQ